MTAETRSATRCSAPQLAAIKGAPRTTVELLAAKGADVNWANGYGDTALHNATIGDQVELVRTLGGTHGADLNAQDKGGYTPLHYAAEYGETASAARALLELGADASLREYDGLTALEYDGLTVRSSAQIKHTSRTAGPRWSSPRRASTRPPSCCGARTRSC